MMEMQADVIGVPTNLVDRRVLLSIASDVIALIRVRTMRGTDAEGRAFKAYSTKRIYISREGRGTGARLAPKGGVVSRTGRTMRFDGGYREFKLLSRGAGQLPRGGAATGPTSEVDLTLSGEMLRGLHPEVLGTTSVVIQPTSRTAEQAAGVSETRPFIGIAPSDRRAIEASVSAAIARKLAGR